MTQEWRKAICHRNRHWKIFTNDGTQRNRCTSLRCKAIREFFCKKVQADNPRQFWKTYQPFLHSRNSKQANDIMLIEKDSVITDNHRIAEICNERFVHIADGIGEINELDYRKDKHKVHHCEQWREARKGLFQISSYK